MKFCKDCRYGPLEKTEGPAKCQHRSALLNSSVELVFGTNWNDRQLCEDLRRDITHICTISGEKRMIKCGCGPEARWFEPRPEETS